MKAFYQIASIGQCVDVQFVNESAPISLASTKTTKGWNLINSLQQVHGHKLEILIWQFRKCIFRYWRILIWWFASKIPN